MCLRTDICPHYIAHTLHLLTFHSVEDDGEPVPVPEGGWANVFKLEGDEGVEGEATVSEDSTDYIQASSGSDEGGEALSAGEGGGSEEQAAGEENKGNDDDGGGGGGGGGGLSFLNTVYASVFSARDGAEGGAGGEEKGGGEDEDADASVSASSGAIWGGRQETQYAKSLAKIQAGAVAMTDDKNAYTHKYKAEIAREASSGTGGSKTRMKRMARELKTMRVTLPLSSGASAFIRADTARPYVRRGEEEIDERRRGEEGSKRRGEESVECRVEETPYVL